MLSPRAEFQNGLKAELPIMLGDLRFGMIYSVLALQAGLPPALALAMSSIVFAGSSQFIGAQLMAQGAGGLVIVATTFVVNLRHALYSASVAPFVKHMPLRWKVLLAYLLTDEAYAVTITRFTQPDSSTARNKHWFYFGAGITLWTSWQISTAIGIFVGQLIPESWRLIVEEPMVGLDPAGVRMMKAVFRSLAKGGTTIFMSTHTLGVAEDVCDRIGIIHRGTLIAMGPIEDLRQRAQVQEGGLEEVFMILTEGDSV